MTYKNYLYFILYSRNYIINKKYNYDKNLSVNHNINRFVIISSIIDNFIVFKLYWKIINGNTLIQCINNSIEYNKYNYFINLLSFISLDYLKIIISDLYPNNNIINQIVIDFIKKNKLKINWKGIYFKSLKNNNLILVDYINYNEINYIDISYHCLEYLFSHNFTDIINHIIILYFYEIKEDITYLAAFYQNYDVIYSIITQFQIDENAIYQGLIGSITIGNKHIVKQFLNIHTFPIFKLNYLLNFTSNTDIIDLLIENGANDYRLIIQNIIRDNNVNNIDIYSNNLDKHFIICLAIKYNNFDLIKKKLNDNKYNFSILYSAAHNKPYILAILDEFINSIGKN